MNSSWTDEYYDIIDFYYWEPQHLGKQKSPKSPYQKIEDVFVHIRKMEVSLNHQMNIFFRLVPNTFLHQMLHYFFNRKIDDKFMFQGQKEWRKYVTENDPTQPDIFFSGSEVNFAIELKVTAKSTVEQIVKYLLLHYLNERHFSKRKQLFLLYLSPDGFSNLWKPSIQDMKELNQRVMNFDYQELKQKTNYLENVDWDAVLNIWPSTAFSASRYQDFSDFLQRYRTEIKPECPGNETLLKLVDGMIHELEERHLASI